ncbi:UNKNOWN [Stylonychia lemnae]|uniref:BolA-like protein n=1 Tax=Stylonychia lemnae TaxID=5949 RepID=A0A078AU26_STYLE|nr:UNKNOWN [Stylonychia lemnae]|eukprot:CDW85754.1 UNKNOWN [Stylonychia lemnae]
MEGTQNQNQDRQESIQQKLRENLDIIALKLVDQSGGCGASFDAIIVAKEFTGMSLLNRQKRVNEILADEIPQIHAFTMKTWDENKWEKEKANHE